MKFILKYCIIFEIVPIIVVCLSQWHSMAKWFFIADLFQISLIAFDFSSLNDFALMQLIKTLIKRQLTTYLLICLKFKLQVQCQNSALERLVSKFSLLISVWIIHLMNNDIRRAYVWPLTSDNFWIQWHFSNQSIRLYSMIYRTILW